MRLCHELPRPGAATRMLCAGQGLNHGCQCPPDKSLIEIEGNGEPHWYGENSKYLTGESHSVKGKWGEE